MDPSLVQKLLPELEKVIPFFEDVVITCFEEEKVCKTFKTNSLILAAVSPMLAKGLEDVQAEDQINIFAPEGISVRDLEVFFRCLFNWDFDEDDFQLLSASIRRVSDLLLIPFYFNDELQIEKRIEKVPEPEEKASSSDAKSFKCEKCDANFSSSKLLKRHSRTIHSENHPHVCHDCGRRCRGPSELVIHQRCHSKEKPFRCDCGKSFAQKSQLNDHISKVHDRVHVNICQICGLTLASERTAKRHARIHLRPKMEKETKKSDKMEESENEEESSKENENSKNRFKCQEPDCDKVFKSANSLKFHSKCHSGGKNLSCPDCGKMFTQQSHLNVHVKILHEGAKPFMCSFCGRQFAIKSNLKKHLRMHERKRMEEMEEEEVESGMKPKTVSIETEPKPSESSESSRFVCQACGRAFSCDDDLISHARTHQKSPFFCDTCQMTFETWSAKKIHQKEHTGGEQFVCEICQLSCLSRSALTKHELTHTGERPHACTVRNCEKKFVQKSHLNYHIKVVHGPPIGSRPKTHPCLKCGTSFATSSTLRKHERTHNDDRRYACDVCGKRFIQKTHLDTHRLRHTGDRPFGCDQCDKKFVTSSNLSEHLKAHSGNKRVFACTEQGCDAKYASSFDLKVHTRKHTGELPFPCLYCLRAFRSKRLLEEHSRVHTGEFPFFCSNCSKTFTTGSGLKQHFRRHDTCRLAATPGAFSISSTSLNETAKTTNLVLNENESALLADSILAS